MTNGLAHPKALDGRSCLQKVHWHSEQSGPHRGGYTKRPHPTQQGCSSHSLGTLEQVALAAAVSSVVEGEVRGRPQEPWACWTAGVHLLKVSSHLPHPRLRRTQQVSQSARDTGEGTSQERSRLGWAQGQAGQGQLPKAGWFPLLWGHQGERTDGVLEQVRELAVPVGHVATAR